MLFFRANSYVGPDFFMRNGRLLLLLFLVVAICPYLLACFYALPFADDFCFGWTASENISFVQKFLKQYLGWNGRYTADVLVNLHPITTGRLWLYQLVSFVSIVATPLVFFALIKQWVEDALAAITVSLFISVFYLCYLPDITDGVYWYIGLVNYHWGSLCFIAQLALLAKLRNEDGSHLVIAAFSLFFLIVAIGFNEIGAALIPAFYIAMLTYLKVNGRLVPGQNGFRNTLWIHFIVALVASAFVICSPGNFARERAFDDRFNLMHSVLFAGLQTIRFIGQWVLSVPFIALSLVVMVSARQVKSDILRNVHVAVWLLLLLFTVFIAALIPYLATGILGQHRTMNYVLPFFILLWLGFLLGLSTHYGISDEATPETTGARVWILAFAALIVMSVTGNAKKIWIDLYSGVFPKYRTEFMVRQATIIKQPLLPVYPLQCVPLTFQIVDVKGDTTWWADKCMKRFYTKTNIVLH